MKKKWIRNAIYYGMKTKTWKIMRLSAFFLFLFLSQVWAESGYSQQTKLTLKMDNARVIDVLDEIENNSEFYFLFNQKLVDVERKVDVNAKEKTIGKILTDLFVETDVHHQVKDRLIILTTEKTDFSSDLVAEQKIISGTITDESGQALPGVTVVIKGTTQGTVTNTDGNYSILNIPENVTLVFSFVGMIIQEIVVENQTLIDVVMREETIGIDEVVVIGYGTQKKSNLTAAVEMVDTKMLENRPVRTVGQMLEGAVPNLNIKISSGAPDANPSFNIRGFTGFGSSGTPLILIDGVEQNINMINANDIESISVLKDASASAIYGSRAPHGVILIVTKSGKKGQKMQINYSGDLVINQPTYIWDLAESLTWANTVNNKQYNSFKGAKYSEETLLGIQDNLDGIGPVNVPIDGTRWGWHFNATNATQDRLALAYREYSTNQAHNINIQGGTDKTTYYMGVGYFENQGIYNSEVDKSDRYNAIIKINTELADWLSIRGNLSYSRQEVVRPNYKDNSSTSGTDRSILGNGALYYFPNVPSINPDGNYHWLSVIPTITGVTGQANTDRSNILLSGGFDFTPIKDLIVQGNFSYMDNSVVSKKDTKSLMIEEYDSHMAWSGRTAKYDEVEESMQKYLGHTIDIHATYTKDLGKHNFLAMAGYQQDIRESHTLLGSNRDVYTTEVMSLSTTYGVDNKSVDDNIWHWATQGYFFRASYNYNGIYLIDFNSRYDAASKYAPDSRWAYFPSVSAGYNIAKENFWPVEQVQMFKVTGSWGKLGDQAGGNYLYLPTMGTYAKTPYLLGNNQLPYVTQPGLVSSNLTWTKPRTIGVGLEVSAFKNRLQAEYRWYQRTIFDQLGPAEKYPEVLGTNPPQSNNAVSETRGWELSVGWKDDAFNIMGSPLRYEVRGVVSDYIGYVVEYEDNTSGKRSGTWTPGEEFGILWGYSGQEIITDANDLTEKFLWRGGWNYTGSTYVPDANGDGRLNSGDGSYWYSMGDYHNMGYTYPRYKYSILLSTGWKSLDLSVFLDGVGKQVYYSTSAMFIGNAAGGYITHALQMHEDLGYYSESNPDAFYPRAQYTGGSGILPSENYIMNLAHLRIKNVNLAYSLPAYWASKVKLSYIKLNVSAENLGFVYNKLRLPMDPVQVANGGNTYPVQRVFSFGVRLGL